MISIIMCVYNTLPVVRKCLASALWRMGDWNGQFEVILVHNHSPDKRVVDYMTDQALVNSKVSVVIPERNLGCHNGWNFGYQHVSADASYVVKLDDDMEMQTDLWAVKMMGALDGVDDYAFVYSDSNAIQGCRYKATVRYGIEYRIPEGWPTFSCVMFRRSWVDEVGLMLCEGYRTASGTHPPNTSLYGGEEVYYARKARETGLSYAMLPFVYGDHHSNEDRDCDYPLWKLFYGYMGWTTKDLIEWRNSGEMVEHYKRFVGDVHAQKRMTNFWEDARRRLLELGVSM